MRSVNLILIGLALAGFLRPAHTAWAQAPVPSGTVITIAGNGTLGFAGDGGPATSATLHDPHGLAIGPDGTLYFVDAVNFRIRAVDPVTGIITTFAGSGSPGDCFDCGYGGPATEANMSVVNLAVDRARNALYFSDIDNNWVPKVDLSTGLISVYAGEGPNGFGFSGDGGPANGAFFVFPQGVAVDASGRLSIADLFNDRIRQVDPDTGIITTIAGYGGPHVTAGDGGPATAASFAGSAGIVSSDSAGNVFVTDQSASTHIRRIDAVTGIITTVAGGGANPLGAGTATDINLGNVHAYTAVDDDALFFAHGNRVFKVDLETGQLSLFAGAADSGFSGDGGPALDARFNSIGGLALAPGGGLLISDTANQRIRYITVGLAGDYNHNGVVDAADYTVWRNTLGQVGAGLAADGNASGEIEAGDYDVWKSHFGAVSPGIGAGSGSFTGGTVPEPASGMLLLAASVVFTLRVKKSSVVCSLREQKSSRGA